MTRAKYRWTAIAAVALLAAASPAWIWWKRKPAPRQVEVITDQRQIMRYYDLMNDHLFNVWPNGTLRLFYQLNHSAELPAAFRCVLNHEIEITPDGTARSCWVMPFTQSYVAPFGTDDVQWRMPNGRRLIFKNGLAIASGGAVEIEEGWRLRKFGPGTYSIDNGDGDGAVYINGHLIQIITRGGRHYQVTTRGGLITGVKTLGGRGSGRILFSAEYDDFGNCTRVQFAGQPPESFDWADRGVLKSWRSDSGRRLGFQYKDGLLVRVIEPGNADFPITWSENMEFVHHDVDYGAPVYVKSAGVRDYSLSYSSRGICIAIQCPDKKQDSTAIYAPRTHILVQQFGRQTWRFDLEDEYGAFRPGKVEIIDLEL